MCPSHMTTEKQSYVDLAEKFLNRNRQKLDSTPARIPGMKKFQVQKFELSEFSSLPRRNRKNGAPVRQRKSSTQSDFPAPKTRQITSPNGLTASSLRRLNRMKESQQNIKLMLEAREAAVSELESDFEETFCKARLHLDDGLAPEDKVLTGKGHKNLKESIVYPCDTCGRIFFHTHALQAHKLLHSGSRSKKSRNSTKPKVKCNTCGKLFSNKWKLRFHQATHFNEKNTKVLLVL